jgi:hypothetical protein
MNVQKYTFYKTQKVYGQLLTSDRKSKETVDLVVDGKINNKSDQTRKSW